VSDVVCTLEERGGGRRGEEEEDGSVPRKWRPRRESVKGADVRGVVVVKGRERETWRLGRGGRRRRRLSL
jgi:hypothetical protein